MRFIVMFLLFGLLGCSAIDVEKLNTSDPEGLPFYLDKSMIKVTKITYEFYRVSDGVTIKTINTEEREVVSVTDKNAAYTVNQTRSFAGENKFGLERSNDHNINKVSTENKEGLTEFLKGLVEGGKTLTELAKEGAKGSAAAPAGVFSEGESTYFSTLAQNGILVFKTITSISFEDL